jgi:hypothetical protein
VLGNDIATFTVGTVAVMFEGLAYTMDPDEVDGERKFWHRKKSPDVVVETVVRKWKPREMPIKSLIHMIDQLHQRVEVYTYYDVDYLPHIEHWLARKGASVMAYSYEDLDALKDDFKFNRDVHTLYTPFEDDAAVLGLRCTVMELDKTWGI